MRGDLRKRLARSGESFSGAGSIPASPPRCQTVSAAGIEQLHGAQAPQHGGKVPHTRYRTWGFIAMSSLSRDIADFMESVGAVRSERLTGSDHIRYTLPNGGVYFTSLTPSDQRALKNIKSDVRRMLGTGNEGGKKAASYSKKDACSGFSMETVRKEQQHSAAIREIVARNTALIYRLDALLTEAQRNRDQREGERLVAQYMSAKATLERYYQPVPELSCKSNAVMAVAA